MVVDHLADLPHLALEDAVGRRVGEHQRRQPVAVAGGLVAQVGEVDVALVVAGHRHHPEAGHHRAGRVGAVRRGRDQADVAPALAAGLVVGADDQQAAELALRARVGLQRHRARSR